MAKNFPYFKFMATDWLTGDIVYEDLEAQGLFINICALYWQRDAKLTQEDVIKRYKNESAFERLKGNFLKVDRKGNIQISFLDEQLLDANHISQTNSKNGKKGGRPKAAETEEKKPTAKRPESDRKAKKSKEEKNKNKSKEEKKEKEGEEKADSFTEEKPQIEFPFTSVEFKVAWFGWKKYLQDEWKIKYQSFSSEQAALKTLNDLSGGDEKKALHLITWNTGNRYKTFYPDKDYGKQQQPTREDQRNSVKQLGKNALNELLDNSNSPNG